MSMENVRKFLEMVKTDEKLARKVVELKDRIKADVKLGEEKEILAEKVVPLARDCNLEFTVDDFIAFANSEVKNLSKEDLLAISGGKISHIPALGLLFAAGLAFAPSAMGNIPNVPLFEHVAEAATTAEEVEQELVESITALFTESDLSVQEDAEAFELLACGTVQQTLQGKGIKVQVDKENSKVFHCTKDEETFDINIEALIERAKRQQYNDAFAQLAGQDVIEDYLKKALDTPEDVKVGIIEQIQQQAAEQELSKPQVFEKFVKTITSETCKMLSSKGVKVTPDETDPYLLHCARGNEKFDVDISNLIEEALQQKDVIKAPKKTNHETAAEKTTIGIQWKGKNTTSLKKMTLAKTTEYFAYCINKWITDKKVNLSNDAEVEAFADEAFRLLYEKAKEIDEDAETFDKKSRTLAIGKDQYTAVISVNDMILRNKLSNGIVKAVQEKIATYKKERLIGNGSQIEKIAKQYVEKLPNRTGNQLIELEHKLRLLDCALKHLKPLLTAKTPNECHKVTYNYLDELVKEYFRIFHGESSIEKLVKTFKEHMTLFIGENPACDGLELTADGKFVGFSFTEPCNILEISLSEEGLKNAVKEAISLGKDGQTKVFSTVYKKVFQEGLRNGAKKELAISFSTIYATAVQAAVDAGAGKEGVTQEALKKACLEAVAKCPTTPGKQLEFKVHDYLKLFEVFLDEINDTYEKLAGLTEQGLYSKERLVQIPHLREPSICSLNEFDEESDEIQKYFAMLKNAQLDWSMQINVPYTPVDRKNSLWQKIVEHLWIALNQELVDFDLNKFGKVNRKLVEEDLTWLNKYIVGDLGKCYIKSGWKTYGSGTQGDRITAQLSVLKAFVQEDFTKGKNTTTYVDLHKKSLFYTPIDRSSSWSNLVKTLLMAVRTADFDLSKYPSDAQEALKADLKWFAGYIKGDLGSCYCQGWKPSDKYGTGEPTDKITAQLSVLKAFVEEDYKNGESTKSCAEFLNNFPVEAIVYDPSSKK